MKTWARAVLDKQAGDAFLGWGNAVFGDLFVAFGSGDRRFLDIALQKLQVKLVGEPIERDGYHAQEIGVAETSEKVGGALWRDRDVVVVLNLGDRRDMLAEWPPPLRAVVQGPPGQE